MLAYALREGCGGGGTKLRLLARARMPSQILCGMDNPYLTLANGKEL